MSTKGPNNRYHKFIIPFLPLLLLLSSPNKLHSRSLFESQFDRFSSLSQEQQWDSLINYYAYLERVDKFPEAEQYSLDLERHFRKEKQYEGLWKLYNHQMLIAADRGENTRCETKKQQLIDLNQFNLPPKYQIEQSLNFGYLEFFNSNYDASISIWKEGLRLSLDANTSPLLTYQFYSNLGSAYFSKNYLRTAAHYFLLALHHAETHQIPHDDLFNNLAAVSISSRDFSSAKEYLDNIKMDAIRDPYLRLEIETNRLKTAVLIKDETQATTLYQWLVDHINDFPPIKNFVLATLMEYHIVFKPEQYPTFLKAHPEVFEISDQSLDYMLSIWTNYPDYCKKLPIDFIEKLKELTESECSPTTYSNVLLCLAYATGRSNYWESYETQRRLRLENLDSLLIQDFSANLRTVKLEFEREELQANIDRMKTERLLWITFMILILGLSTVLIVVYRNSNRRKAREQLLNQELIESQQKQISYSQNIMEKAKDWINEIQQILDHTQDLNSRKRLQALKSDFSILGKVKERQEKRNQDVQEQVIEPIELHQLNKTELTVARYLMRGMRTKEIGIFMELSPVYVNNVRYQIRKKLQIPKEVSVEDYLQKINES